MERRMIEMDKLNLWLQEKNIILEESFTSALRRLALEYKKIIK